MTPKQTKRVTAAAVLIIVAAVVYFLFSPEESDFFPQCPFHYLTGLDCPGCGSQRAIHNLLHLQMKEAFFFNPLLVISLPYILVGIYFEYFGGKEKHITARKILFGKTASIILFVVVISYWIGRNIIKFI